MLEVVVGVVATFVLGVISTVAGYVINLGSRVRVLETRLEAQHETLLRMDGKLDRIIEGRGHVVSESH